MHLFIIHQFPDLDTLAPIIYKIDSESKGSVKILSVFPVHEFKNYKFSNEIYLGIRPEHIHPNLKHEIEFNINIDLIENLGSDKIIYGLFKDNEIRIRTSEDLPQNNTSFSFNTIKPLIAFYHHYIRSDSKEENTKQNNGKKK